MHREAKELKAAIVWVIVGERAGALERKEKRAGLEKHISSNRSEDVFTISVGIKVISELSPF